MSKNIDCTPFLLFISPFFNARTVEIVNISILLEKKKIYNTIRFTITFVPFNFVHPPRSNLLIKEIEHQSIQSNKRKNQVGKLNKEMD